MKTAAKATMILVVIAAAVLAINRISPHDGTRRYEIEIRALSAALDTYKGDHGNYPSDPLSTEQLKPNTTFDPVSYVKASQFLYVALSGSESQSADGSHSASRKTYFEFKPRMLRTGEAGGTYIVDPWGNSYGYSTFKSVHPDSGDGNNPTFDLWSTAGGKREKDKAKWTTNW